MLDVSPSSFSLDDEGFGVPALAGSGRVNAELQTFLGRNRTQRTQKIQPRKKKRGE
jgi:hypothetical protein